MSHPEIQSQTIIVVTNLCLRGSHKWMSAIGMENGAGLLNVSF